MVYVNANLPTGLQHFAVKEHGLNHITFYVQKRITHLAMCYDQPLIRDKPLGASARICETRGRRY